MCGEFLREHVWRVDRSEFPGLLDLDALSLLHLVLPLLCVAVRLDLLYVKVDFELVG